MLAQPRLIIEHGIGYIKSRLIRVKKFGILFVVNKIGGSVT